MPARPLVRPASLVAATGDPQGTAMKAVPLNRYLAFFSIAVAGCAVDLVSKNWIFGRPGMSDGQVQWVWDGVFGFRTDVNRGALFGLGQGLTPVFAALSVAAALGILFWLFYLGAARDRLLCVALGCVMAGILGNLYDRLGLHGLEYSSREPVRAVRDWILVMIGKYEWPAFNIADSLLVCGAVLLLWHALGAKPKGGGQTVEGPEGNGEDGGRQAEGGAAHV
jgi:signal peptidase II